MVGERVGSIDVEFEALPLSWMIPDDPPLRLVVTTTTAMITIAITTTKTMPPKKYKRFFLASCSNICCSGTTSKASTTFNSESGVGTTYDCGICKQDKKAELLEIYSFIEEVDSKVEGIRTTIPPVSNPYELSTESGCCEDWSSVYMDPTTVGGTLLSSI